MTQPEPPYHVFPPNDEFIDTWHGEHGHRVHMPRLSCALCQLGMCVQFTLPDDDGIVLHGRWLDG